jgi:flagellar FliL protein
MSIEESKEQGAGTASHPETNPETGELLEQVDAQAKLKKKKLVIVVALVLVLLLAGTITFLTIKKRNAEKLAAEQAKIEKEKSEKSTAEPEVVFYDFDDMIINLNTEGKSVSFLKLKITVELKNEDSKKTIEKLIPRIKDIFQVYLRELRPTDLQGSVGLYKLKEELLLRINKLIYPSQANDILFREIIVQ